MALKDWKKWNKSGTGYYKLGFGGVIFIGHNSNGWFFEHGVIEYFKTRKEAMASMINYMRSH